MATDILKSFSHLQSELEDARSSLKGVDENIKRLIGRDPSDLPPRNNQKRLLVDDKNSRPFQKFSRGAENDDISKRRNPNTISVFKRLSEKVPDDSIKTPSKGLISKVVAAPKEVPSRQAVLDKQNKDEKFKARNRRMFGALLGTLQKFQQEESKLKKKEEKRTQIEKKIEEHEQQEKEEIKKERQELFLNRKKKQQEIKMIELKMLRMKEYAAWEHSQKPRTNFIITKAKPHIHYLPRKMNDKSKELLGKSKQDVEEQIEKRRQEVADELNHIEERMKRNFEVKNNIETKEDKGTDRHERHKSESEDDDGDVRMKSLSPEAKEVEHENTEENGQKCELSIENDLENHSQIDPLQNPDNSEPNTEQVLEEHQSDTRDDMQPQTSSEIPLPTEESNNYFYGNTDDNSTLNQTDGYVESMEVQTYSENTEILNNIVLTSNENIQEVEQENI